MVLKEIREVAIKEKGKGYAHLPLKVAPDVNGGYAEYMVVSEDFATPFLNWNTPPISGMRSNSRTWPT